MGESRLNESSETVRNWREGILLSVFSPVPGRVSFVIENNARGFIVSGIGVLLQDSADIVVMVGISMC